MIKSFVYSELPEQNCLLRLDRLHVCTRRTIYILCLIVYHIVHLGKSADLQTTLFLFTVSIAETFHTVKVFLHNQSSPDLRRHLHEYNRRCMEL